MTIKVRIHFTLPDNSEDSLDIEADTIEEIRERAAQEVSKRNATNPWSEEL